VGRVVSIVTVDHNNYDEVVSQRGIVLVDCWAAWCGACATFAPAFERVAERHPSHAFAKLDTQAEKELVDKLGVESIPTLQLYRDGILLFHQAGTFDEERLEDIVAQAEVLDMEAVKAEIASHASA
jgi:thioredoxin 1